MKNKILWVLIVASFYFSATVVLASFVLVCVAVYTHQPAWLVLAFLNLYVTPLVSYRVFHFFYPIKEGRQQMWPPDKDNPSTWVVGHKIQLVYEAMPWLEHILVMVPGLYAFWLRRWGSKVGGDTFFTPQVEITDRGLVEIGDHSFFGHRVFMSSHLVIQRGERYILFVRRIKIGERCFVGAMSNFGPGTEIEDGSFVPLSSYTLMNDKKPRSLIK